MGTCDDLSKCSVRSETGEVGNKCHVMVRDELSKLGLFSHYPGRRESWLTQAHVETRKKDSCDELSKCGSGWNSCHRWRDGMSYQTSWSTPSQKCPATVNCIIFQSHCPLHGRRSCFTIRRGGKGQPLVAVGTKTPSTLPRRWKCTGPPGTGGLHHGPEDRMAVQEYQHRGHPTPP